MRFAIRDDDTNFFTTPAQLEACYHDIWREFPVTLCVISQVKGNWERWVHEIYRNKHHTDWDAWKADDTIYPIEANTSLVTYVKDKIGKGQADIAFHAKHHRNEDPVPPQGMRNNYVRGAEFYTSRDLTDYIRTEVDFLNQLFDTQITAFTAPQNLLSMEGYKAVVAAGLNICGGGITFYKKEKDLKGLVNIAKQATFKMLHQQSDYPYMVKYSHHSEIPHHYPLQPGTQLQNLIDDFEMVRRFNGDFVLSTHYVEFDYPMVYDEKRTMKQVLLDFLDYISKYKLEKLSMSRLLNS